MAHIKKKKNFTGLLRILALKTTPSGLLRHNNRNTQRIQVTATNYFQT